MAGITNNGTVNNIPASQKPDDYTDPSITEISDYKWLYEIEMEILKVTVDESDPATTMAAIIDDASIGIDKQADDIIAEDFLATRTVTHYQEWTAFKTNMTPILKDDDILTDEVTNYLCAVKIYVKTAVG